MVGELNRLVDKYAKAADGPQIATRQYSTPVYKVPVDQPVVRVQFDNLPSDAGTMQTAFEAVPIPPNAKAADGLDMQLTVWQPSTDKLWELWKAEKRADGWHARWGGAIEHVSTDPGFYTTDSWPGAKSNWGASGTSLPLIAGTVLIKEAQEGKVDHALAMALPTVRYWWYSWPAQRSDGNYAGTQYIPEGAHFRVDPTLNVDSMNLSPFAKMLAKAMQRYGVIVRDVSSTIQLYGEDHTPTGSNPWPGIIGPAYPNNTWSMLAKLPWKRMQLLKMDVKKNYDQ